LITPHARYRINSQYANEVRSPEGKLRISVRITEDIMPGVVCLLAGMWPALGQDGIDTAGAANMLTSTVPTEPSGSSRTHSAAVQVRPV
jgi:anaerobic selenocysteine-containing dehydrogenase